MNYVDGLNTETGSIFIDFRYLLYYTFYIYIYIVLSVYHFYEQVMHIYSSGQCKCIWRAAFFVV